MEMMLSVTPRSLYP